MTTRIASRIRALFALAIFALGGGGAQLADALVFHSHPASPAPGPRVNAGDHCHSENCDLGAPIASAPPPSLREYRGRFAPTTRQISLVVPIDAPRALLLPGTLGSRAPPLHS